MSEIKRKECGTCYKKLPLTEFHRRAKSPDGRQTECKECKKKTVRKYRRNYEREKMPDNRTLNQYHDNYIGPKHTRDVPMKIAFCRACGCEVQNLGKVHWCAECRREIDAGYREPEPVEHERMDRATV